MRGTWKSQGESRLPGNFEVLLGSSFYFDLHSKEYSANVLSQICHYSQDSTVLVLDNLDNIYGALYDLFNQRFASSKDNRYCNVIYEDFKKTLVINQKFKCIILKNETDLLVEAHMVENVLPSPLMNRFEKHLLSLENITREGESLTPVPEDSADVIRNAKRSFSEIKERANKSFHRDVQENIRTIHQIDVVFLLESKSFFENLYFSKLQEKKLEGQGARSQYRAASSHFENKITVNELLQKVVKFYTTRMLILHMKDLERQGGSEQERLNLLEQFERHHPHDSLAGLCESLFSQGGTGRDESGEKKPSPVALTKTVVLTYTNWNLVHLPKRFGRKDLNVHTLNMRGSEFFKETLAKFVETQNCPFLVIIFKNNAEMRHFHYISQFIDNFHQEARDKGRQAENKHILLVHQKTLILDNPKQGPEVFNWQLNLTGHSDWNWVVIENLVDSFYG